MRATIGTALKSTLGVLALTTAACDSAVELPTATPEIPTTPEVIPFESRFDEAGVFVVDPRIPAAWRNDKTFAAQKGDQYDDTRAEAPQHFAITQPPVREGLRAMVEWEPMQALAMSFPGYMLSATNATQTVVQIAKIGSDYGEIWIFVDGNQAETGLKSRLASAGMSAGDIAAKIKFIRSDFDSIWFIDSGPMPLVAADGTYAFADFRYYHERPLDDGLPTWIGRNLVEELGRPSNVPTYRMPLNTEGGTFQATTDGVCITGTRQIWNMSCLTGNCQDSILESDLADVQDHAYTLEMESVLEDYTGCQDLVVTHSITDDGTGHIDMYLKILDDDRILLGEYDDNASNAYERENAVLMDENAAFLEAYVKPDGGSFEVHRLPMPGHRSSTSFGSVPFTYINSTFFNGVNLWPATVYANWEASRDEAQGIWDELLPNMQNVWIDATELSFYSGAIHCITRTIPAKTEALWIADGACGSGACTAPDGGYDDECRPSGVDEDICWGPEWLCDCNDCESGCEGGQPDDCDGVAYEGCCESGDLLYCDGGQLFRQSCGNTGCGWNQWGGYYDCEQSGQDPTGDFPIACGGQCQPDCDGKTCGDDGCGGTCGSCTGDAQCVGGVCRDDCVDCAEGDVACDGTIALLCQEGATGCNVWSTFDCGAIGQACAEGLCTAGPVEPNPEVGPEQSAEPGPEPTADPGAETTDDDATTDPTLTTEKSPAVGKKDEGCAGSGADGALAGLVGVLMLIALRRRSARMPI